MKRLIHIIIAFLLIGLISQGFGTCIAAVCCQLEQANCCSLLPGGSCPFTNPASEQRENPSIPSRCGISSCDRSATFGYPASADQLFRQTCAQNDEALIHIASLEWIAAGVFLKTDLKPILTTVPILLQKQTLQC